MFHGNKIKMFVDDASKYTNLFLFRNQTHIYNTKFGNVNNKEWFRCCQNRMRFKFPHLVHWPMKCTPFQKTRRLRIWNSPKGKTYEFTIFCDSIILNILYFWCCLNLSKVKYKNSVSHGCCFMGGRAPSTQHKENYLLLNIEFTT